MKLFAYDRKHDRVFGELDVGPLTEEEQSKILNMINWMTEVGLLDGRYRSLKLANSHRFEKIAEESEADDDEYRIVFSD